MNRITGAKDLFFDAVEEITNLVERTHARVSRKTFRPLAVIEPVATVAKGVQAAHDLTASSVYGTIRLVNRGIRKLIDAGTGLIGGLVDDSSAPPGSPATSLLNQNGHRSFIIDHAQSALNALYGDYLGKRQNGLDIGMAFRHRGRILPLEREAIKRSISTPAGKICIFVHGLGCTEWIWRMDGQPDVDFGSMLRKDLGYTPLYVRYNTGRHVSENGRRLSALLARLWEEYPREIEEIVIIGHSMGGLVARSAAHYGKDQDESWIGQLRHIFFVGSPNLGAPLEKGVNILGSLLRFFKTAGTQVPAEILNSRSAGIKDLRFGYTMDEEWAGKDPDLFLRNSRQDIPFVDGVGYYFIAATITKHPEHPAGRLFGDLLVRVPSASGKTRVPERAIAFRSGSVFSGMHHMKMASHPEVYGAIRRYIEQGQEPGSRQ